MAINFDPYNDPTVDALGNKTGTFTTTANVNSNIISNNTLSSRGIIGINNGNFTIQPLDTIQGQMIIATLELDEMQQVAMDDIDIKNRLLNALTIELLSAKCIEFTKQHDVARNTMKVRARIFATPDSQVRLIRNASK